MSRMSLITMCLLFLVSISHAGSKRRRPRRVHDGKTSWGRRTLLNFCEDSSESMENLSNLDSTSSCAAVHHVMKTLGKGWYCSFFDESDNINEKVVKSFAKFPEVFNGEYTAKCTELKEILENWESIGDALSSGFFAGADLNPATFKILDKNIDSGAIKYNIYIAEHEHNHLSAYFEEPRSCGSKRSHFVFHVLSWGTQNYFESWPISPDPEYIIKNIHKAFIGVPGENKNVFNEGDVVDIVKFQFPLGQMHKVQEIIPKKGDLWNYVSNSCAAKVFQVVKRAFEGLGTVDLQHPSPVYDPSKVFGFLKNLANKVPNGHLLSMKEREAIIDDAYNYGVENWAGTFDEPIESLPQKKQTTAGLLEALMEMFEE